MEEIIKELERTRWNNQEYDWIFGKNKIDNGRSFVKAIIIEGKR